MRLAVGFLFVGLLFGIGISATLAAHAEGRVKCPSDNEFKPIRGFCSEEYLRFDVLDEIGHAATKLAREKHFPLVLDWEDRTLFRLAAQIRHNETPLRSRMSDTTGRSPMLLREAH